MLDDWLKRKASSNQASGASRTFVVADQHGRVCGYYALAAGAVSHQLAPSGVRRKMPDPVPVMVLARHPILDPFMPTSWLARAGVKRLPLGHIVQCHSSR